MSPSRSSGSLTEISGYLYQGFNADLMLNLCDAGDYLTTQVSQVLPNLILQSWPEELVTENKAAHNDCLSNRDTLAALSKGQLGSLLEQHDLSSGSCHVGHGLWVNTYVKNINFYLNIPMVINFGPQLINNQKVALKYNTEVMVIFCSVLAGNFLLGWTYVVSIIWSKLNLFYP